jgi:hypothetical protein
MEQGKAGLNEESREQYQRKPWLLRRHGENFNESARTV